MEMEVVAQKLVKLAKELVRRSSPTQETAEGLRQKVAGQLLEALEQRDYLTVEEVEVLCPPCAEKMRKANATKVAKKHFFRQADMTWDECIAEAKATGKRDPEAFCGWLRAYGPHGTVKKGPKGKVPKGYHPEEK